MSDPRITIFDKTVLTLLMLSYLSLMSVKSFLIPFHIYGKEYFEVAHLIGGILVNGCIAYVLNELRVRGQFTISII
jgi:hypothetical protein